MAEEIVACPGCAKKFRIPEGADSGSFACTACGVDVPYGAAAKKAATATKPAPRPAATRPSAVAAPARAAPARAAPASSTHRSSRRPDAHAHAGHGRRPARDDADEPKKSNAGLIWGGIAVGGIAIIAWVYYATKPDTRAPAPTPSTTTATAKPADTPKATAPKPADQPATDTTPTPTPTPAKPAEPVAGAETPPPKPVDTKPAATGPAKVDTTPTNSVAKHDNSVLGQTFENVAGETPEERAELDKLVALAMDRNSGKDGANAETTLVRKAKKSIPSLLSAFSKQYSAGKWSSDEDQWSADKIQDLLHRITGQDCIYPDYWPKFMSGASAADFEKAATLWVQWWANTGQAKEKYRRGDDAK